jgi:O-antigen/teichoic acid export membrane protein
MSAVAVGRGGYGRLIAWNTIAQALAHGLAAGVGIGLTMVLTRHLGPAGYGSLVAVLAFVGLASFFFDWGTQLILTRELSQPGADAGVLVGNALALRLALGIAVAGTAAGVGTVVYSGNAIVRVGILLAAPRLVFGSVTGTLGALFQARLKMGRFALADLGSQAAIAAAVVALVLTGGSFREVVLAYSGGAGLYAVAALVLARRLAPIGLRFDLAVWRRLAVLAAPLGVALLLNTFYFRADVVLLSVLRGSTETGLYGISARLVEALLVFPGFFLASVFPLFALHARAGDRDRLRQVAQRALDTVALVVAPVAAGIAVAAPQLVRLVAGDGYAGAVLPLRLVIVAGGLMALNGILGHVLVALDRQRDTLWLNAVALALNVGLNLAVIPAYGAVGAAWVMLGSELAVLAGNAWLVRRYAGFAPGVAVAGRALAAAGAAAGIVSVVSMPLAPAALLGAAVYVAVLAVLRVRGQLAPALR